MVAEAYLSRLGERGIEYVFANAGTDFAPIWVDLAQHRRANSSRNSSRCRTRTSPWHGATATAPRQARRGDGARHRRDRQRGLRADECGARRRAVLLAAGAPLTEAAMSLRATARCIGARAFDQGGGSRIREMGLRAAGPVDAVVDAPSTSP
jgi:hypothetical protein